MGYPIYRFASWVNGWIDEGRDRNGGVMDKKISIGKKSIV